MFKPKNKALLWCLRGFAALGAGVFVFFAAIFTWGDPFNEAPRSQNMNDPAFRQAVESHLQLSFPASVRWRGCHMTAWQDTTICGSFAILKSDIPKLFPASMKVDWSASQKHLENSNYNASWFKPDSVKVFKSAEVKHPTKNCSLRMLYDDSTDSNTLTTMYLTWGDM